MCGGKLKQIDEFGHATCEYCGSTITLTDVNDKQIEFENLLINARRAVEEKNWADVEKYYNLLQKKFPKAIIIESTFFRAVAKVMLDKSLVDFKKQSELWNSLDLIEKYYDTTENIEENLNKISELLFTIVFPKGQISYSVSNKLFYKVMVKFNNTLEQLSKTHNETYLYSLISKHRQIITSYKNKRENYWNIYANVLWCIWSLALFISAASSNGIDFIDVWIIFFIFGILPGLIIKTFIKLIKI